jgi:hypothetical protein
MDERRLHREALKRIELALEGRSWLWLSEKTKIPQSTLQTQKNVRGDPKFSLEVLAAVAEALGKPLAYFLPSLDPNTAPPEAWAGPIALSAFNQIAEIVDHARSVTPDEIARARDVSEGIVPGLPARRLDLSTPGEPPPDTLSHKGDRGKKTAG